MKNLLFYNQDSKFVTDQTDAGGDGTNVVSVVNGVAWTKDEKNAYFRYSGKKSDYTIYTVTVNYVDMSGVSIANSDTKNVKCYNGRKTTCYVAPKFIEDFEAVDDSGNTFSGEILTVTGNMTYSIKYKSTIIPPPKSVTFRYYRDEENWTAPPFDMASYIDSLDIKCYTDGVFYKTITSSDIVRYGVYDAKRNGVWGKGYMYKNAIDENTGMFNYPAGGIDTGVQLLAFTDIWEKEYELFITCIRFYGQ